MREKRILITGGAGFIGSSMVRHMILRTQHQVLNVDKLSYAASLESLDSVKDHSRHKFSQTDICHQKQLTEIIATFKPDAVIHFAAESHVDRSISGPEAFIVNNVQGTFSLLEATRSYWSKLAVNQRDKFRFVHVSTDEVFGSLGNEGFFSEESPYQPNSPYSASKAASDHLARAWFHTYGLPVIISNCSNNFGPFQSPEKLIPHVFSKALNYESIPVYGEGKNIRDWLFVGDHVHAISLMLEKGKPGESYCIGARNERTNLEIIGKVCQYLNKKVSDRKIGGFSELITFVKDRAGHDFRYAINPTKIETQLEFKPNDTFDRQFELTMDWYFENQSWTNRALKRASL